MKRRTVASSILHTVRDNRLTASALLAAALLAVGTALVPPLILESIINRLASGTGVSVADALLYFGLIALSELSVSIREILLTVFGQKVTKDLRKELSRKLSRLPAAALTAQDPGETASRFVSDVDTVEALFTSGIISMASDLFSIISIFVILWTRSRGLALLLLCLLPLIFLYTRHVQKRMLAAETEHRAALAKASAQIPETLRSLRTIRSLGVGAFMKRRYQKSIDEGYAAIERTNFYDAVYSPVILFINAAVTGIVMALSASGSAEITGFFGMSAGTSVAVINYIAQVFTPIESLGMEIQTIQSAMAGVKRIGFFLNQPEWQPPAASSREASDACIELRHVSFAYEEGRQVLSDVSFSAAPGERITIYGRTGAGKSTVFKLLQGLYVPQAGQVLINGRDAASVLPEERRSLFGYVEQTFRRTSGTVRDQITLSDARISPAMAEEAARLAGLHEVILQLPEGYDTPCTDGMFSQGQWQLLSIARAAAARPKIILLDEITANLDAQTEQQVLTALGNISRDRTVLSISHRLYEQTGGRLIHIG